METPQKRWKSHSPNEQTRQTALQWQQQLGDQPARGDAQAARHRDVDQPAEVPLCSFVLIKSRQKQALIEKDYQQQLVGLFVTSLTR
jgi:hypothetical protein